MAFLGKNVAVSISTPSVTMSEKVWTSLGFSVIEQKSNEVFLSDGQLLLNLVEQEFFSPAVCYYGTSSLHTNRESVVGPDREILFIRKPEPEYARLPLTGEKNSILGFFDAVAVGSPNHRTAREWSETLGFFVQEEFGGTYPQSEVTDGLINVSFRNGLNGRFLCYVRDLDDDDAHQILTTAQQIQSDHGASRGQIVRDANGDILMVVIYTAEGTGIIISQDL